MSFSILSGLVCSFSRSRLVVNNVFRSGEPSRMVREGCREMGASQSENLLFSVLMKLFAMFIVSCVLRWILSFHICSRLMLVFSIKVKLYVSCLRRKTLFIEHNIHNIFYYFFVFFVSEVIRSSVYYQCPDCPF